LHTIVILSTLVDSTVRDGQLDTDFILLRSLEELGDYIELTPIRAEKLYITKEILQHTNTSLSLLASMLENPFLAVEKVTFITEEKSREIPSIRYIIDRNGYKNWEIIEGFLTREYIHSIVTGTASKTELSMKRKVVYRVPRDEYILERAKERSSMGQGYEDDEQLLKDIPAVTMPVDVRTERNSTCQNIHIAGLPCYERTVMSFVLAQYMSLSGKTLILEKDTEYHRLTEIATKSGVDYFYMDVTALFENVSEALERIRHCNENLIVVGCVPRTEYHYTFMLNILYSNLGDCISYMIVEEDMGEIPALEKHIVVLPTLIPDIIKTCEQVDGLNLSHSSFVAVQFGGLNELRIDNSRALQVLLTDLLEVEITKIPVVQLDSLRIGGEGNDLRSIIGY